MKQFFLASVMMAMSCVIGFAQTNFSGTWNFENQESISGKLYSNGSPKTFVVKQSEQNIMVQRTSAGANGDVTTSDNVLFDGKPTLSTTSSGRPKKVSASLLADHTGFTMVTELFNATDKTKLEMKITDQWKMDGGKLVLQRKNENFTNGEVWESKAWYVKGN